ncbi:hypothetical protein [Anaerotruncus colihominis]|uniref:Uncharacterized protein n=1 Tax=Anaerotruncus colihominis TaxID=169435 RepID=A0A845SRA7_9FIRM|nr:hypothetical protein [Anaerotruncus colihominis]MCR2026837.1 hypothetical protein [Anaerotruncus colihominis]NDO39589.1 hypothetical protein [Anaerotruncus colihominis]
MKKLLAAALAVATVASLSTVSFAAETYEIQWDSVAFFDDGTQAAYDGANSVKPDKTLYFAPGGVVGDDGSGNYWVLPSAYYTDKGLFKVKTDKGDENAKMIKSMALSEKNIQGSRGPWFEIKLNDDFTDREFKINPSFTLTAKDDFYATSETVTVTLGDGTTVTANVLAPVDGRTGVTTVLSKSDKFVYQVGKYYISNTTDNADQDYMAGTGGIVLKPNKNDDNTITWEDANNTIATLTFYSDDNAAKFFPKLTTKWDNTDYAEYFADQNAFIFDFVGRAAGETKIASTSRATLELYNPYYDWDEDLLTVAPEDCVIYQIVNGELVDVTASFTALQNDDGDYVFQTKTRELGCYIIAEAEASAVVGDPTAPVDEKPVPNTGR